MFSHVMRFVNTNKPKIVILENVSALLTHDNGSSFAKIMNELKNAGYNVTYKLLKCSGFGIPQMRKRLFIICTSIEFDDIKYKRIFNLQKI